MKKLHVTFALSLVSLPMCLSAASEQAYPGVVLGADSARSTTQAITEQATQIPGDIYRGTVFGAEQKTYEGKVLGDNQLATKKLVYDTSLIRAIKIEDADRVRTLMYANVDANEKNYAGITPLTVAGEKGNMEILTVLVENGKARVNDKSSYGVTPLIAAAAAGKSQAVLYLLEHGADATSKDDLGKTALSYAAGFDEPKTMQALLSQDKLSVNIPDNAGNTPIIYAAQKGILNNVKLLLAAGAKPDYRSPVTGVGALAAASAEGHVEVVRYLVKNGKADVNLQDLVGRTPIFYAVEKDQPEVLQVLLSLGADPNHQDNAGVSALMRASAKDQQACQKILLRQKGIDVNAQDNVGRSVLTYAVYAEDIAPVQALLSAKADVNTADLQGNTPLMSAIKAKNDRAAVLLIQHGANLTTVNQAGETAFTLAQQFLPNSATSRVLSVLQKNVQQQALQVEAEKLATVRALEEQLAEQEQTVKQIQEQQGELTKQPEVAQAAVQEAATAQQAAAQEALEPVAQQAAQAQQTAEQTAEKAQAQVTVQAAQTQQAAQKQVEKAKTQVNKQASQAKQTAAKKKNTAAAKKQTATAKKKTASRTILAPNGERIPKASVAPQEVSMADLLNQ